MMLSSLFLFLDMTNKELAAQFKLLGDIMELHGENAFKIRSYSNAYLTLRKYPDAVGDLPESERANIKGIGKAINAKITELVETGSMQTLERYKGQTPSGLLELLQIKGLGAKKVRVIWKELGIESLGELSYAINENRLVELNGFGAKTQESLKQKLEYFQQSKGFFHYAYLYDVAEGVIDALKKNGPEQATIQALGTFAQQQVVGEQIELLVDFEINPSVLESLGFEGVDLTSNPSIYKSETGVNLLIQKVDKEQVGSVLLATSAWPEGKEPVISPDFATESAFFEAQNWAYIPASIRHLDFVLEQSKSGSPYSLVEQADIQGVIHNHSTYSDGMNSMEEMVQSAQTEGYNYMLMTDHSKAAFYANGLKEERVIQQWEAIEALNASLEGFTLLKGIECDILSDGSLDYEPEILKGFDAVIVSVHSNLNMDEAKATARIIKAIENPYAHILGHPTGRLLLSRKGYPIDHQKIIDACASNGVHIELNANPWRLDLDPQWIPYAMEKGVQICINPDAHSIKGIQDIKYGVLAAQSGGLTKAMCLNAKSCSDFLQSLKK